MLYSRSGLCMRSFMSRLGIGLLIITILFSLPVRVYAEAGTEAVDAAAAENAAEPVPTVPVRDPLTNHLTNWPQMTEINEDSAVLMDADTGAILYSLDRDVQRIPASITKIMTCLLVLENTQMDEVVTMTEAGMAEAYGGSSNISPVLGEQFTVEQCLYMLMLKSANDIAAQLAEYVGGSVEAFVQMMNDRCAQIGTTGTHFNNPNGLPGDNHYTTAMDMALIMQECLRNETFRQIISTPVYTVPPTNMTETERTYENHCKLIIESDTDHYYPYCIGGKTGYTDLAWRTLVTAAEKDGRTLICVTLHGPDNSDFTDHKNLLEYGFNSFYNYDFGSEAGEEWDLTGGVTIPIGFDLSGLTKEEKTLDDGSIRTVYTYENNPVGTVLKKEKPKATATPVVQEQDVNRTTVGPDEENSERTKINPGEYEAEKGKDGILRTLLIVLTVLIILLVFVGRTLYVSHKKQKEREEALRRKRAARRKRRQSEMNMNYSRDAGNLPERSGHEKKKRVKNRKG